MNPELIPGGRIPCFLIAGNDLFEVFAEARVQRNSRVFPLGFTKDVRDWPSARLRRANHGDGPVILLDDDFDALLDLDQHGVEVARDFGFAHVDGGHGS